MNEIEYAEHALINDAGDTSFVCNASCKAALSNIKRTPGRLFALRATTALRSYWMHQADWIAPCSPRPSVSISGHNAAMNSVHSLISLMRFESLQATWIHARIICFTI